MLCSSLLFKIMTTDKTTKKRRLFSAAGFADNLERLLNISDGNRLLHLRNFAQSVNLSILTILGPMNMTDPIINTSDYEKNEKL